MTLRPAYTLGHSEYNAFLFAVVDEGDPALPLTVLSALARLGLDPWQEAARLAALPRDAAAHALAQTIAALPRRDQSASGSQATAARLVSWLPARGAPIIPAVRAAAGEGPRMAQEKPPQSLLTAALPWAAMVAALLLIFFAMQHDNNLEPAARGGAPTEPATR